MFKVISISIIFKYTIEYIYIEITWVFSRGEGIQKFHIRNSAKVISYVKNNSKNNLFYDTF